MNSIKRNTILIIILTAVLLVVLINFRFFHYYLEHVILDEPIKNARRFHRMIDTGMFNMVVEFLVFLTVAFFNYSWVQKLIKKDTEPRLKSVYIVLLNLALLFIFLFIEKTVHQQIFKNNSKGFFETFYLILNLSVFLVGIIIANFLLLYRKIKITEIEKIKLKEEKTRAELILLKEQISPHFFFNTLSTLSTIIRNEKKEAGLNFIQDMSNTYRYAISSGKNDLVTLDEEIEFLNSYVILIKKRFGEKLSIDMNVDQDFKLFQIPPMSLQILVENVIQHNVITQAKPVNIDIFVEDDCLVVKNNLQGKGSENGFGLGLQNLSNRFKLLLHKDISILKTKKEFIVKLPLK